MPSCKMRMSAVLAGSLVLAVAAHSPADSQPVPPQAAVLTYADLADLADGAPMVIKAQIRKIVAVEPERARGLRPGWARFYVEARTEALISGKVPIGEALRYLVDLRLDAKGRPPALKKKSVVLFARPVAGRPSEIQLVAPDAQALWNPALDQRVRSLLGELLTPGAPHKVSGVREAIHVGGNLAGEGETQLFLSTVNGEPAAITVTRQPGQAPRWTASFSEVVGNAAAAPAHESLAWYRLACFLPSLLPAGASVSESPVDRAAAGVDYRFVMSELGACPRTRPR